MVVAIVLVLAALAFIGTGKAFTAAYKADAIGDLKGLTSMTVAAATDNNGLLPILHDNLASPHHLKKRPSEESEQALPKGTLTVEDMYENGLTEEGAFCKNFPLAKKRSTLEDWLYDRSYAVFSYVYLANDNGWAGGASGGRVAFPRDQPGHLKAYSAAELRQMPALPSRIDQTEVWYPYIWAGLCRTWQDSFLANFISGDYKAKGLHVVHLDGHIEWKNWDQIERRYTRNNLTIYW